jgi:hypothetical protein
MNSRVLTAAPGALVPATAPAGSVAAWRRLGADRRHEARTLIDCYDPGHNDPRYVAIVAQTGA